MTTSVYLWTNLQIVYLWMEYTNKIKISTSNPSRP